MTMTDGAADPALQEADSVSFRDFRPGAFALRDTWFPLVHSVQIGRRGVQRSMHGRPVYLTRVGDRIAAHEDSPSDRARRRARASEFTAGTGVYPVADRYGYAWVWYGDPAHASVDLIPNVPHIPAEGMPRHMQGSVIFDCSYELVCENLLDLTHADFLHSALTGDPLADDDVVEVSSTSETVTMVRTAHGRPVSKIMRKWVKESDTHDVQLSTLVHIRSGVCVLHGNFNPGPSIRMLHPVNPESHNRSRTTVTYNPQFIPTVARNLFPITAHTVGRQDNWAVRVQNRAYQHDEERKDLNSRFDRAGIRYRKVYQELVNRQMRGDYSYLGDGDPGRDVTDELGLNTRR